MSPIWLLLRFRVRLERLRRLAKGDNRDLVLKVQIKLSAQLR